MPTIPSESIDPRRFNKIFSGSTVAEYLNEYSLAVAESLKKVSSKNLASAVEAICRSIAQKKRVYVAGNGGSAAISEHLCCDLTKGTHVPGKSAIRTYSLVSNTAFFTALGNDYGYERTLSTQVEMYGEPQDVLILISSSGNSANVIEAANAAKKLGMTVIGFTGFSGGRLKEISDISIHVDFSNYGVVEDCHQMIMHSIAQIIAREQDK